MLHFSGLLIDARSVTDDILGQEGIKPVGSPHHEIMAAGVAGRARDAEHSHGSHGSHGSDPVTNNMSTITPDAPKKTNRLGLDLQPYRGSTTLCAGCGHNAISERIVEAFYEMGIDPKQVIKLSGIGCSSKSPAYFLGSAHGFNTVHGRMPSVGTGAMLANRKLIAIGVSGDGDTGAIGIGQFVHLMRRNRQLSTSSKTTAATA